MAASLSVTDKGFDLGNILYRRTPSGGARVHRFAILREVEARVIRECETPRAIAAR